PALGARCGAAVRRGSIPARLPARGVIRLRLLLPPRKEPTEFLHIPELVADEVRGIGVVQEVLAEEGVAVPTLPVQHVADQPADEGYIAPGADREVHGRTG